MSAEEDQDIARVKAALHTLGEHFDSVHIFATRHEPVIEDGTITVQLGIGNWHARYGQIHEWLIKEDQRIRAEVHRPDDSGPPT